MTHTQRPTYQKKKKKKKKKKREEVIPIRYVERKLPLVVVVFEGRQLIISLKLQSL